MIRILPVAAYLKTGTALVHNALVRESRFPFYASLKLTSRCHFGCPFCNVKQNPVPDMPTDQVIKILDNLSRSSVLMTSFEGGEPLLRADICELLRYARRCNFYLLFTTSHRDLLEFPLSSYAPFIDFFHVSIDEGHGNLSMFDNLSELRRIFDHVSVQSVVTADTLDSLGDKVARCAENKVNIVIIPATHMDGTDNRFPDLTKMENVISGLRHKYPGTIHTPQGYFPAVKLGKCSSASIIIAPDGSLYYPCHILGTKGPDLGNVDLDTWLKTKEAAILRQTMRNCPRNCGWYQYYSVDSYTSISSVFDALRPLFFNQR